MRYVVLLLRPVAFETSASDIGFLLEESASRMSNTLSTTRMFSVMCKASLERGSPALGPRAVAQCTVSRNYPIRERRQHHLFRKRCQHVPKRNT